MESCFIQSIKNKKRYPKLQEDLKTDICIVGAGITGSAIAYLASKDCENIVVLESDKVGGGITGNTTGKITSQHGLIYNYLYNSYSPNTAQAYLESNEEALKLIEDIIINENIECEFEKKNAYIYTCDINNDVKIKEEVEVLKKLNYDAEYVDKIDLPFDIISAIKFKNQAQFNAFKYVHVLINILDKKGVRVFEESKVVDIKLNMNTNSLYKYNVIVNDNIVKCKYLVLATHYPIKNFPGMYFIKMYQDTSYVIGITTNKSIPNDMYLSIDVPTISFRNVYFDTGEKMLLIGGSGHKTGDKNVNIEKSYMNLEEYAKIMYPDAIVKCKWTNEDCVSLDKVPYIGEFSNFLPNFYVATGYKKWGMTTSHVAAKIITDKIFKRMNPYSEIYKATRLKPLKNSEEFSNIIGQAINSIGIDRLKLPEKEYEDLKKDTGGIIYYNGEKIGVYKDKIGKMHAVIPYCKHLGCELSWNNLEKTWDCPCHGSRYHYNGEIITGPTVEKLITDF